MPLLAPPRGVEQALMPAGTLLQVHLLLHGQLQIPAEMQTIPKQQR